jgi:hypothetical protein
MSVESSTFQQALPAGPVWNSIADGPPMRIKQIETDGLLDSAREFPICPKNNHISIFNRPALNPRTALNLRARIERESQI